MCPSMSFIATILYDGINAQFISNWFQKIVFNFPFAFFIQMFLVGPVGTICFQNPFCKKNT